MNMYEKRLKLRELLMKKECTPLMGAYDVLSAKIIEQTGFPVVYTGSFVTGASRGALPDVGLVQMHDLLELAREIAKETNIPIVCDADTGWYHAANIWRTVHEFESAGASAIHIEDTVFGKHTAHKAVLLDHEVMVERIRACCDARVDKNFMIIARTDALYLNDDEEDAVRRINAYLEAGADAGFIVFKGSIKSLKKFRAKINGPLITTSVDFQDSLAEETDAGSNMSVYWPLTIFAAFKAVKHVCEAFYKDRDATKLKEYCFDEGELNCLMPYQRFNDNVVKYKVLKQFSGDNGGQSKLLVADKHLSKEK
ncbi:isocitrate lyase/PEP mutase family protein [Noviherbaspirillum sedimenti]|uniref:Carboxyvinyl-carboxyphosphonate phosphorylmutase n=1 Tax=Noviherbaspirillum sedimenti TaxID=2320865 RepID=A0A3A3G1T0_9BURK|nr:isocitrate lyase/PEP mutase family protein [Noviherbaspirillum sedimenti]RJG00432.1 carboxyvinyl-carboxyphosphonate phosphorylmutase [Noviherbaspirillum sedimenti]